VWTCFDVRVFVVGCVLCCVGVGADLIALRDALLALLRYIA